MNDRRVARTARLLTMVAVAIGLLAASAGAALARAEAAPRATQSPSRYAPTMRDGRAAARALLQQSGAPSLSLALVSNGHTLWRQTFGYADKTTLTRPASTTMYGIGSVSKMLATIAVMQLVDGGLVSLDEPFATYVPAFAMASPGYRDVTVRMLLDHSSGFPGSTYGSALGGDSFWPGYLQYVLDTLAGQRLKHTPGFLSVYCNDGFTMVEALVPAVTGKSFTDYLQDEVLAPLGMNHSAYPVEPFAAGSYAKAYNDDGSERPREILNVLASGGLYSTPTDMGKLATMLADGGLYNGTRILSATSVAEMGRDQMLGSFNPVQSNATRYGLGWDSVTQAGLKAVGVTAWMKGGDSIDYHAGFVVAPKARLSAVVTAIAPLSSGDCETLCERILLHALVDRGTLERLPALIAAAAPPVRPASATQLARIAGYWAGNGMAFHVEAAPGHPQSLTLSRLMPGGAWAPLHEGVRLRTDGRFHAQGSATAVWTTAAAGRRYLISRAVGGYGHYRDSMMLAQKLRPGLTLSPAWQDRVGHVWLAANERPDSPTYTDDGAMLLAVGDVPGLDGYVTVYTGAYGTQVVDPNESDDVGLMFLQIPGFGSRDLNDAVVEERGDGDWITYSSTVYRPLDSVPALIGGPATVQFGVEGYTEWRLLPASSLTISAGTTWRLYDGDLNVIDSGTTFPATTDAPNAAYLALFGPASSTTTVTVVPADPGLQGTATPKRSTPQLPEFAPPLR